MPASVGLSVSREVLHRGLDLRPPGIVKSGKHRVGRVVEMDAGGPLIPDQLSVVPGVGGTSSVLATWALSQNLERPPALRIHLQMLVKESRCFTTSAPPIAGTK